MYAQNDSYSLSTEQVNLISKNLENIPFDAQLNGEFLSTSSSTPLNILITEMQTKQSNSIKTSQTKNSLKNFQQNATKPSGQPNSLKNTEPKSSSQNIQSKSSTKGQNSKVSQQASAAKPANESQDPSKLDDWLDSLLS